MKLHSSPARRATEGDVDASSAKRIEGSVMSDYIKPVIGKKGSVSSAGKMKTEKSRKAN